ALKNDLLRLFEAPFAAGELVPRDTAIKILVQVATELKAYPTEIVTVGTGELSNNIPRAAGQTRVSLRQYLETRLAPAEQPSLDHLAPPRVLIALRGGPHNGTAGDDLLIGSSMADTLEGGDGTDYLFGGDGADTLRGGNNYDILVGGQGNDILEGGAGPD